MNRTYYINGGRESNLQHAIIYWGNVCMRSEIRWIVHSYHPI